MGLVVQKYGGSSVSDAERIKRVAERIVATRKAGNDVVVVPASEVFPSGPGFTSPFPAPLHVAPD